LCRIFIFLIKNSARSDDNKENKFIFSKGWDYQLSCYWTAGRPFFYFIKLYFILYIKPNAIEEHMREIIDLITLTWSAKKYDYIINMHHGASKEKES
jgi:hypothetical protein